MHFPIWLHSGTLTRVALRKEPLQVLPRLETLRAVWNPRYLASIPPHSLPVADVFLPVVPALCPHQPPTPAPRIWFTAIATPAAAAAPATTSAAIHLIIRASRA